MSKKPIIYDDERLRIASTYLKYHIRMYVETMIKLDSNEDSEKEWPTMKNALLEAHLVQARALIDFVSKSRPSRYDTDVLAVDYFHDNTIGFRVLQDEVLTKEVSRIGDSAVHITTIPMPMLKSEQGWQIHEIASRLVPTLIKFLQDVPRDRLVEGASYECLEHLKRISPKTPELSVNAST